jgi:predicted enzyme related to lactoylglutathione lyase
MMSRINFVELPASDLSSTRSFYADAFGLAFTDFGPSYSCTLTGDVDIGLQGDASEATSAPLAVIAVDDLEASFEAVGKAGGIITKNDIRLSGWSTLPLPRPERKRARRPQSRLTTLAPCECHDRSVVNGMSLAPIGT